MSHKSLLTEGVAEATEMEHSRRRASSVGKIELGSGPDDSEGVMGNRSGAQERGRGSASKEKREEVGGEV